MNYIPLLSVEQDKLWRIKLDPVYRLVDNEKWLDNFFNDGEIMLGCFNKFRQYPNEFQGDSQEGNGFAFFVTENKDTVGLKYEGGLNSYILSTTTEYDSKIIKDFNAVGAIKILNTTGFATIIGDCLSGFTSGLEGHCIYADSRVFQLSDHLRLQELYKLPDAVYNQEFREEFQLLCLDRELFLKHNKYKYQKEYRFVWHVSQPIQNRIIIKCPELISLCERINF